MQARSSPFHPVLVEAEITDVGLLPGEGRFVRVFVQNNTGREDLFDLEVQGIPARYIFLDYPAVYLKIGEKREVGFTIHLPDPKPASIRKMLSLLVSVSSRTNSMLCGELVINALLQEENHSDEARTDAPFVQFSSELMPPRINAGQTVSLKIKNEGQTTTSFRVSWQSQGQELEFVPSRPNPVQVAPGQTVVMEIAISPRRLNWMDQPLTHRYAILVKPILGNVQAHMGVVVSHSLLPVWIMPAFLMLCLAGMFGLGFVWNWNQDRLAFAEKTADAQVAYLGEAQSRTPVSTSELKTKLPDPGVTPWAVTDSRPEGMLTVYPLVDDEKTPVPREPGDEPQAPSEVSVPEEGTRREDQPTAENSSNAAGVPSATPKNSSTPSRSATVTPSLSIMMAPGVTTRPTQTASPTQMVSATPTLRPTQTLAPTDSHPSATATAEQVKNSQTPTKSSPSPTVASATPITATNTPAPSITPLPSTAVPMTTQAPTDQPEATLQAAEVSFPAPVVFLSNRDGGAKVYSVDALDDPAAVLFDAIPGIRQVAWSPDGQSVLLTIRQNGNDEIFLASAVGDLLANLTVNSGMDQDPAWSPDSSQIAFTSDREGNNDIFVMNRDGSNAVNLTQNPADDETPAWFSANGSAGLLFVTDRDGNREIYSMNKDGANAKNLTRNPGDDERPVAGPEQQLLFQSNRNGNWGIFTSDLEGEQQTLLTDDLTDNENPSWSPDGQWFAYQSNRNGNKDIYIRSKDGAVEANITHHPADDEDPLWK
jgi:hypothetical protein